MADPPISIPVPVYPCYSLGISEMSGYEVRRSLHQQTWKLLRSTLGPPGALEHSRAASKFADADNIKLYLWIQWVYIQRSIIWKTKHAGDLWCMKDYKLDDRNVDYEQTMFYQGVQR
jgi:hypothetical protein